MIDTHVMSYRDLIKKITEHLNGESNSKLNLAKLREMRQYIDEPFTEFVKRIREKAKFCSFTDNDTRDREIKLIIIEKYRDSKIKAKALAPNMTIKDLIEFAKIQKTEQSNCGYALPNTSHGKTKFGSAINLSGQEPFTSSVFDWPVQYMKIFSNLLYLLIKSMHPDRAANITGMLLELDNAEIEILLMLESRESLRAKVDEAVVVLQAHQIKQQQAAAQRQTEQ